MAEDVLATFFSSSTTFLRPGTTSYFGAKFFSTSTARVLAGRSRTCPMEALTVNPRPRNLLIVFAFAGDSTMTSDFATDRNSFSRLLKKAHLQRWPAWALVAAYLEYASLGPSRTALHLDLFEQPG